VLARQQPQRWQVEQLAGLHPDHRRVGKVQAAPAAPAGGVPKDFVRLGDLGQVGAWGAGLLAGPAMLEALGGAAFGAHRLAQAVQGRRLGRVGRIPAKPAFQLGHPRLQRGDQAGLLGVGRAQLGDDRGLDRDGGFHIRIGSRDRGLEDNQRSSPLAHGP
jgi:hypothetical protein